MRISDKDISGCAIAGILCEDGRRISGETVTRSIALMRERSNGLGGGFAAYGIYPDYADHYCFHVLYDGLGEPGREEAERIIDFYFEVEHDEPVPIRRVQEIGHPPRFRRYFLTLKQSVREEYYDLSETDLVIKAVMKINGDVANAFVVSSGKNMGVFKGVGYPEDISRLFMLEDYKAYLWTAHGRFPTNTSGWWGGAHPFGILDWSVVHNGEISSYGINRRFLQDFGYECTMFTDTEVIAYICDLLIRKHELPVEVAARAMAPPFWEEIDSGRSPSPELDRALRIAYGGAMLNGPFSIVVGFTGGMFALSDRLKLRPASAARADSTLYVASEESAIRAICPDPDEIWNIDGGVPVIGRLRQPAATEV